MTYRARKTRTTKADKIREYMKKHPDATPTQVAKALKVKVFNVHSTLTTDRRKGKAAGETITFTIDDVKKIKSIGIEKAKQIIKLLEAL